MLGIDLINTLCINAGGCRGTFPEKGRKSVTGSKCFPRNGDTIEIMETGLRALRPVRPAGLRPTSRTDTSPGDLGHHDVSIYL